MAAEAIRRFSYGDQNSRFIAACGWLTALGLNIHSSSRMATYARDLEQIDDYFKRDKIRNLITRRGYARLLNSLIEATELMDIHEGLSVIPANSSLIARLQKFLSGSEMLVHEKSPANVARSTGFELLIAALAAGAGLPVNFDSAGDLLIPLNPNSVRIECKRPLSHSKMPQRIRQGIKQLNEFYKADEMCRGILALSVSKAENDGSLLLPARDAQDVDLKAFGIIDKFRRRHERHWKDALGCQTIAILLHLRAPCLVESPNVLTVSTQLGWVAFDPPDSPGRATLEQIFSPIDTYVQKQRAA